MQELDHQSDNVAQRLIQFQVANHKAADTLKEPQLLFNAFELLLEFPDSAGHALIMAQAAGTVPVLFGSRDPMDGNGQTEELSAQRAYQPFDSVCEFLEPSLARMGSDRNSPKRHNPGILIYL